jgi:hypothetical protein
MPKEDVDFDSDPISHQAPSLTAMSNPALSSPESPDFPTSTSCNSEQLPELPAGTDEFSETFSDTDPNNTSQDQDIPKIPISRIKDKTTAPKSKRHGEKSTRKEDARDSPRPVNILKRKDPQPQSQPPGLTVLDTVLISRKPKSPKKTKSREPSPTRKGKLTPHNTNPDPLHVHFGEVTTSPRDAGSGSSEISVEHLPASPKLNVIGTGSKSPRILKKRVNPIPAGIDISSSSDISDTQEVAVHNAPYIEQFEKDKQKRNSLLQPIFPMVPRSGTGFADDPIIASQLECRDARAQPFVFEILDLALVNYPLHPMMITYSLYCLRRKMKLTEDFSFIWHAHLLPPARSYQNAATKCLFNLVEKTEDIILLVRLTFVDSETKSQEKKKVKKDKVKGSPQVTPLTKVSDLTTINRRPFVWGGTRIFTKKGDVVRDLVITLVLPKNSIMEEEGIMDSLEEKHKKKSSEGTISITLKSITDKIPNNCITSSYIPLKPYRSQEIHIDKSKNTSQIIRELQVFEDQSTIYNHFFNQLFVYPLKIMNWKHKGSAQLVVRLMRVDNSSAEGLSVIYGFPLEELFTTSAKTAISPEAKQCFFDEFKIELPYSLEPSLHLLFTVIHVDPKKGKQEVAGYAFHPLVANSQLNTNDMEILELYIWNDLPENYLSSYRTTEQKDKQRDKMFLMLRLKLASSIIVQDPYIYAFFHMESPNLIRLHSVRNPNYTYDMATEKLRRINELQNAKSNLVHRFFLPIAQVLLTVVCNPDPDIASNGFLTLLNVLKCVTAESKQRSGKLLKDFATWIVESRSLSQSQKESIPLFEAITRHFLTQVKHQQPVPINIASTLLTIISRSMALHLRDANKLELHRRE